MLSKVITEPRIDRNAIERYDIMFNDENGKTVYSGYAFKDMNLLKRFQEARSKVDTFEAAYENQMQKIDLGFIE